MELETGDVYEGEFKDNVYEGKGVMKYDDLSDYDGYFKNWLKDGKGVMNTRFGDIYTGTFTKDKK